MWMLWETVLLQNYVPYKYKLLKSIFSKWLARPSCDLTGIAHVSSD
jgi:hypothetical protein